ncbi:MAG: DUF763 domain-containing protein [Promethearchaeati archaeon SRVP18_Atabeyarchaeia-1]
MGGLTRTGVADLRLHGGVAPDYLVRRMIKLAGAIVDVFVDEFGTGKLLARLSDPLWFQAFSCVLGYDWDSSGTTTVTCGVLKTVLNSSEHGLIICGGKGRKSTGTQKELEEAVPKSFDFSIDDVNHLKYASRMAAKVDNAAIQDGYHLYHHAFLLAEDGKWAVIQQGMNTKTRMVRRYHWLSDNVRSFVEEPHTGIVCARNHGDDVLDMTSKASGGCRETCTDLANEGVEKIMRAYSEIKSYAESRTTLDKWMGGKTYAAGGFVTHYRLLPTRMNWDLLKEVYDIRPQNYEQLIGLRGVGPATVRGLALISELLYGEPPSWRDPVKFSFAFGGKDGVPFPVERKAMDEATQILENSINRSRLGEKDRVSSIRRLRQFARS